MEGEGGAARSWLSHWHFTSQLIYLYAPGFMVFLGPVGCWGNREMRIVLDWRVIPIPVNIHQGLQFSDYFNCKSSRIRA